MLVNVISNMGCGFGNIIEYVKNFWPVGMINGVFVIPIHMLL